MIFLTCGWALELVCGLKTININTRYNVSLKEPMFLNPLYFWPGFRFFDYKSYHINTSTNYFRKRGYTSTKKDTYTVNKTSIYETGLFWQGPKIITPIFKCPSMCLCHVALTFDKKWRYRFSINNKAFFEWPETRLLPKRGAWHVTIAPESTYVIYTFAIEANRRIIFNPVTWFEEGIHITKYYFLGVPVLQRTQRFSNHYLIPLVLPRQNPYHFFPDGIFHFLDV